MAFFKSGNALSVRPTTTVSLLGSGDRVKVAGRTATVLSVTSGNVTVVFDDDIQQTFSASSVQKIG